MVVSRRALLAALTLLAVPRAGVAQAPPATWRLSAAPSVTIGREGDRRTEFLRIGMVLRLAGGEIAVANGASNEIRIFDRAGRYLRALGRTGAGPGEFRSLSLLGRSGDTLFIADAVNARITLLLAGGTLARTIPITARDSAARFSVVGRLRSGRWAVVTLSTPNIYGPERTYRDTARVGVIAPDASGPVTWMGEFPGMTFFVHNPSNASHGDVVGPAPLGPTSVSAVVGDEVLIGDTGGNTLGVYSTAGAVLRLIQLPLESRPLEDQEILRLRNQALDRNPSERARPYLTALYSRAAMGRTLPVFKSVVPTADGSLWVQPFPAGSEAVTWLVLDAAGGPRASVRVPEGFEIREVGPDYVAGVHTDGDGVETVRVYRLAPPA